MQQNRPILLFDDILSLNNDNLAEKWSRWLNDYEKFAESNGILDQTDPKLIISSLYFEVYVELFIDFISVINCSSLLSKSTNV